MARRIICTALVLAAAFGVSVHAQQPDDAAVYTVTYVETAPASRSLALALLRQYRDDSTLDEGCVRVDVLEQISRQGHFVIVEAWRDQRTSDRHDASARTKTFVDRLKPLLVSPVDTRPYKSLAVGISSRAVATTAVYIVTHVDTAPAPDTDAPGVLTRLAMVSRQEKDNLRFDVLQHSMRDNHFTVLEVWSNEKAAEAHAAAAHTMSYRRDLQPLAGSPLDERSYSAVN